MKPIDWSKRSSRLSGSDIAAIMTERDLTPLYEAKVNGTKRPFHAGEDAAQFGHDVEPLMSAYLERKVPGIKVTLNTRQITFEGDNPLFCATPDGWVYDRNADPFAGPIGIFECKTSTETDKWGASLSPVVNPKAFWQTLFYAWMWGVPQFWIAALVGGVQRYYRFDVEPDKVSEMLERAHAFWRCVETKTPPPVPPSGKNPMPSELVTGSILEAVERYAQARTDAKEYDGAQDSAKQALLHLMGEYDSLDAGGWKVANTYVEKAAKTDFESVVASMASLLTPEQKAELENIIRRNTDVPSGFFKMTVTRKKEKK